MKRWGGAPSTPMGSATDAITFYIAKDMCPVSTVSNQGFKQLANTMDKRYATPSDLHCLPYMTNAVGKLKNMWLQLNTLQLNYT